MKKLSLYSLILAVLIFCIVMILLHQQDTLSRNIEKYQQLQENITQAEKRIAELEQEEEIVGTDQYVERKARSELGYIKENEIIFYKD